MKIYNKNKRPVVLILSIITSLLIGLFGGYILFSQKIIITKEKTSTLDEVQDIIEDSWLDTTNNKTGIKDRLQKGMLLGLGDMFTEYMTKDEVATFSSDIDGELNGIGISYIKSLNGIIVTKVYHHTPAYKALKAGDIIEAIDSVELKDKSLENIQSLLKQEIGKGYTLKIIRDNKTIYEKVTVQKLDIDTYGEIRNNYGYLEISTVGEDTYKDVESILKQFKAKNIHTIVIDLRNNGGGYIDGANDILSLFHQKGEVTFTLKDKKKKETVYKTNNNDYYTFDRGYVLVNEETASSAEIIALNMQETLHYQLIGSKTYGKGIVQDQATLSNGSVLKYTNSLWYSNKGVNINKKGIEPDIKVSMLKDNDLVFDTLNQSYRYNEVSDSIKTMQLILKALGYKIDRIDGYMSHDSIKAMQTFEKDSQLKVTDKYTKEIQEHLFSKYYAYYVNGDKNPVNIKLNELVKR